MEMNQEAKGKTTCSQDDKCSTIPAKENSPVESGNVNHTDNHELLSDGSASAFEGTEFRDNYAREQEQKLREQKKKDYPSGLSNY
ncbi:MAG: hypothetical protein EOO02_17115 [Chitinophagaceae bacterium]|nr:MAG: hypothetical protein EOO02_17115 [Chitinophagaceae bacterium]